MGKITKAMAGSLMNYRGSEGQDALKYIETGDPAALGRIRSGGPSWGPWARYLTGFMADPASMGEEDRRALHAMAALETFAQIGDWLSKALGRAKGDEDLHAIVREELAKVKVPASAVSVMTTAFVENLAVGGRPTSAGRYLLALSDRDLKAAVKEAESGRSYGQWCYPRLAGFLLETAPERLGPLLGVMLGPKVITPEICEIVLRKGADRYAPAVVVAWRATKPLHERFAIGLAVARLDRERYGPEMREIARAVLADGKVVHLHDDAAIWMLQNDGAEALDEIVAFLDRTGPGRDGPEREQHNRKEIMSGAVKVLGARALPAVLSAIRTSDAWVHLAALTHLMALDDGAHDGLIRAELERRLNGMEGLERPDYPSYRTNASVETINLAARWKPAMVADRLWELLGDKAKPVRDAAARALGRLGADAVPRATGMLADRKAEARAAAVIVLATAGTSEALKAFDDRLDEEENDDVRDAMLLALDAAGRGVSHEEIDRRIARTAPKLKKPVAAWLDESRLPALRSRDGEPLGSQATRYLLYRQSRVKEIRPDVEARPLIERIDRSTGGPFEQEVLRQFAASKADARDRWALALAASLGDDRAVPTLNQLVQTWAESSRVKMAEYAVQALAQLGTDAALMCVDATATRYRNKRPNIGLAAQEAFAATAARLGLTVDELGDRAVPRLGFEPGKPRIIEAGGKRIEVIIGPDFKLKYRDLEKNKTIASLPKSLPKETLDEFKAMGATLREVARAQKLRLETMMVRQHRWPVARWRGLFLDHPVLFGPFATRLVWGHYDEAGAMAGTFRVLEDRTLTDAADEPLGLPEVGSIGIVHPLELDEDQLGAWRTHLADYEVEPPFPQLERPVIRVPGADRDVRIGKDLAGIRLSALTVRGRAEKLGWARGPGGEGGMVDAYRKVFPGAGVEAFLELDGMSVSPGMDESVGLGDYYFVEGGAAAVGSDVAHDPIGGGDARLIALGAVPPVVYSEVVGDLSRIASKAEGESEEQGEE
jgi:hypothetical protein